MGILTIARFLLGQRQAILDIAASRQAIWLGLLFVLSAGFAREYDGEDLLHEPWHLMLPLAASLATSTILYVVLWIVLHGWSQFPNEWRTYQSFLALYWMTAPLAWIYAIPVEYMYSAEGATQANLWFLGIIAVWRVLLMIRVVQVVFQAPVERVVFPLMLFADTVMIVLTGVVALPMLAIMGGVRLSESQQMIASATMGAMTFGQITWLIWAVGSFVVLFNCSFVGQVPSFSTLSEKPIAASMWGLAVASIVAGICVLPFTQPAQQRRWEVEQRMERGEIATALALMSQHQPSEYPPHWDPPPQLYGHGPKVPLIDVMKELVDQPNVSPWVVQQYTKKFSVQFEEPWGGVLGFWSRLNEEQFATYIKILKLLPKDDEAFNAHRLTLAKNWDAVDGTPEQREQLRQLFQLDEPATALEQPVENPTK